MIQSGAMVLHEIERKRRASALQRCSSRNHRWVALHILLPPLPPPPHPPTALGAIFPKPKMFGIDIEVNLHDQEEVGWMVVYLPRGAFSLYSISNAASRDVLCVYV